MYISPEDFTKLAVALLIGAIIGLEREMHNKSAGLRTITLITVGATLFTILSLKLGEGDRISANIVSGVGFLGAGAILFTEGRVKGLTTASSIWAAAAMGMAIGLGEFALAAATGLMVIAVLWIFARIDRWLDARGREVRTYLISATSTKKLDELDNLFHKLQIRVLQKREYKQADRFSCEWDTRGPLAKQEEFARKTARDPQVVLLDY
jgi:putative Mg2+ transporter-C (MgtC) family protein